MVGGARKKAARELRFEDLAEHHAGLWAGMLVEPRAAAEPILHSFRDVFAARGNLLAELHRGSDDRWRLEQLQGLARRSGLRLVAAQGVLFHTPARRPLHDVLTATCQRTTVAEAGRWLEVNAERTMHALGELRERFRGAGEALERTLEIADACRFRLSELRYEYPQELAPAGRAPMEYLIELTWQGAAGRYPQGIPDRVRRLLEHELALIDELRYEAYFLTVWDLVRFARTRGILCQGRGSAANSAVCYCLGVTSVDPVRRGSVVRAFHQPRAATRPRTSTSTSSTSGARRCCNISTRNTAASGRG